MTRGSAATTAAALLAALAAAAPATAQSPAPAPKIALKVDRHAMAGEAWRASGSISPAMAGEVVQVRVTRAGRLLKEHRVAPDAEGRFSLRLRGRRAGSYRVVATHNPTPGIGWGRSPRLPVQVHVPAVSDGERGFAVRALQRHLRRAGYVVGRRGVYDARTARAVLAFRKNTGLPRTTQASRLVFRRLARGGGRFQVRFPSHGRHVEADLSKQVMALIGRGGRVERIYPISSGAPSTPTIIGSFRVYRRDFGTNAIGMIHSSYFIRGYAIHGFRSVPIYPASHGCLRVPPEDALSIYNWIRYGTKVDVYP